MTKLNLEELGITKTGNGQYTTKGLQKSLKADDLGKIGSIIEAAIEEAEVVDFGDETKVIVSMKLAGLPERPEGRLALNKTNLVTLCSAFGDELDAWEGKKIQLRVESTLYQGQKMSCIRVYAPYKA